MAGMQDKARTAIDRTRVHGGHCSRDEQAQTHGSLGAQHHEAHDEEEGLRLLAKSCHPVQDGYEDDGEYKLTRQI